MDLSRLRHDTLLAGEEGHNLHAGSSSATAQIVTITSDPALVQTVAYVPPVQGPNTPR
jgi:hypothetical protein